MCRIAALVLAGCLSIVSIAARGNDAPTAEYDMTIQLMPETHHMSVAALIGLPPSNTSRSTIELGLSALMTNLNIEIVEPPESAGPATAEVTKSGRDINHWVIRPRQPFTAGKPIRIRMSYDGGEGIGFTFYLGPEGSFGGQNAFWYPQLEDTRGKGRLVFSVPAGYTVLSTGARRSETADEAAGRFEFINNVPTRFAFAAARYTVLRHDGVVPMRIYLLRPRSAATAYLDGASKVLSTLVKEFGPYRYAEFAIAEVPSEQANKASFSGASMNGFMLANEASLDAPFNLAFYGHEIGHQWWGNVVTHTGSAGNYMLDEAMAQFGSLRVVEAIEGAVAAEEYRRTGYPGYSFSQCGYGYLLSSEMGKDHALGDLLNDNWSHELADSKGFLVLDLLSRTIGRERFRGVLHDITHDYAFRSVTWDEFLRAIRRASPVSLDAFFSQWLQRTGAPEWHVTWQQTGERVRGTITQPTPLYRERLEVELTGENGEHATHPVDASGAVTRFAWATPFRVRSVVVDPHFKVLHWEPWLHAAALARAPALRGFQLSDAGKFDEAEAELRGALATIVQPDANGARYWIEYALGYTFMARKSWVEAEQHFDAALAAPTRDPNTLPFLYWRYAQAAKNLHDDARLRWAADAAVSADAAAGGKGSAPYLARALLAPDTK
jgi:peptidase M1-like protein